MALGKTFKKAYMKAKKKAYGEKGVKGRYVRPGFTKGMGNLIKDVEMIKSRLNVEKKSQELDVSTFGLGQVSANGDGAVAIDITPIINTGTGSDQRIGDSLKMTGMSFPMSFSQQQYCLGNRKVRVSFLRVRTADNGVSAAEALAQVWDRNPLTVNTRDYNAPRRYRNSKTDGISVVRSQTYYIQGPQLDNASIGIDQSERNVKTVRFSVKLNDLLRFNTDFSANQPTGIKYFLVFQTDAGNSNGTTASTLDVPVQGVASGLDVRLAQRLWYVDN